MEYKTTTLTKNRCFCEDQFAGNYHKEPILINDKENIFDLNIDALYKIAIDSDEDLNLFSLYYPLLKINERYVNAEPYERVLLIHLSYMIIMTNIYIGVEEWNEFPILKEFFFFEEESFNEQLKLYIKVMPHYPSLISFVINNEIDDILFELYETSSYIIKRLIIKFFSILYTHIHPYTLNMVSVKNYFNFIIRIQDLNKDTMDSINYIENMICEKNSDNSGSLGVLMNRIFETKELIEKLIDNVW